MVGFGVSVIVLVVGLIESTECSPFWCVAMVEGMASTSICVSLGACVVLIGMGVNIWLAKITASELISVPSSSKAALFWVCERCICWSITGWNSRASHARIPSCHV